MNWQRDKYFLYEQSVQDPKECVDILDFIYQDLNARKAISFREDFCGTFLVSKFWVRSAFQRTALGIDLSAEPLSYGRKKHCADLSVNEARRLKTRRQDVRMKVDRKFDVIAAFNFSFYSILERSQLLRYFRSARQSLKGDSIFVLEMVGGPGIIERMKEKRRINAGGGRRFTYVWDQGNFDPIQRRALYQINFHFDDGTKLLGRFQYDWRMWTIPEVRDILKDAGFTRSFVYWEKGKRNQETGEYFRAEKGTNDDTWIAYIVGQR